MENTNNYNRNTILTEPKRPKQKKSKNKKTYIKNLRLLSLRPKWNNSISNNSSSKNKWKPKFNVW